jgi:hypothetical protein
VLLRLSRHGQTITASYRRTSSEEWTVLASDTITLPSTVLVGLAVSSHVDGTLATATFSGPGFLTGGSTLPEGWSNRDIGAVATAGSATHADGTFTIEGSGADIWGTADEFHFASTSRSGDFDVTAHVADVENVNRWTKAGLMVREALDAGARHAAILATPTSEKPVSFQRRPVAGGTSVHTSGPSTTQAIWLRLVRTGDVIAAFYRLTETDSWVEVGSQDISGLSVDVHVGLAVSSHVDGTLATAIFDHVSFQGVSGTEEP